MKQSMAGMEKWKKYFSRDNLLIVILSGVLLFIIAMPTKEGNREEGKVSEDIWQQEQGTTYGEAEPEQTSHTESFVQNLEAELEEILSQMWGVGKVRAMITLKSSEELVVEKDENSSRSSTNESDSAGGSRVVTQIEGGKNTVYHTGGDGSEPYVIKTISPQVEGVVVVAQGAGTGTVNENITEMIQALFGVEAHKVKVVKMTSDGQ